MFHIATAEDILSGKITDVYFERTQQVLEAEHLDAHVVAEFVVKKTPLKSPDIYPLERKNSERISKYLLFIPPISLNLTTL